MKLSAARGKGRRGRLVIVGLLLGPQADVVPPGPARTLVGEHLLRDGDLKNSLKAIFIVKVGAKFPHGGGGKRIRSLGGLPSSFL